MSVRKQNWSGAVRECTHEEQKCQKVYGINSFLNRATTKQQAKTHLTDSQKNMFNKNN